MYMAKVIGSSVHRFECSKLSFYNYSVHMWSVLGSRLELRFYFEVGKHRERAGILVQNEVHGVKNILTRRCRPTIYALFALWSRCRSTVPQGKQRINCG